MHMQEQAPTRKVWTTPRLTVYGTVAEITGQGIPPKVFGPGDGAVWQGQPVNWAS